MSIDSTVHVSGSWWIPGPHRHSRQTPQTPLVFRSSSLRSLVRSRAPPRGSGDGLAPEVMRARIWPVRMPSAIVSRWTS